MGGRLSQLLLVAVASTTTCEVRGNLTPDDGGEKVPLPHVVIVMVDDAGWGDFQPNWAPAGQDEAMSSLRSVDWKPRNRNLPSVGVLVATAGGDAVQEDLNPLWGSRRDKNADYVEKFQSIEFTQCTVSTHTDSYSVKTPHIMLLAEEGITFTHAHSASQICSPSRAGMLTGRYPQRDGVGQASSPGENEAGNYRETADYMDQQKETLGCVNHFTNTLAWEAKNAHYTTGFFGKWHLGGLHGRDSNFSHYTPVDYGYDYYTATTTNAATHNLTVRFKERVKTSTQADALGYMAGSLADWECDHSDYEQRGNPDMEDCRWPGNNDNLVMQRHVDEFPIGHGHINTFADKAYPGANFSCCAYNRPGTNGSSDPAGSCDHTQYDPRCNDHIIPFPSENNPTSPLPVDHHARGSSSMFLVEEMLRFWEREEAKNPAQRIFASVHMYATHKPFLGTDGEKKAECGAWGDGTNIDLDDCSERLTDYLGSVKEIDDAMGRLVSNLTAKGVFDDTIIIFTSDNGQEIEKWGGGTSGPFAGCKRFLTEGGHAVPFFMRWGNWSKTKKVTNMPVSHLDILPTLHHMWSNHSSGDTAGYPTTLDPLSYDGKGFDGESLWPVLNEQRRANTNTDTDTETDTDVFLPWNRSTPLFMLGANLAPKRLDMYQPLDLGIDDQLGYRFKPSVTYDESGRYKLWVFPKEEKPRYPTDTARDRSACNKKGSPWYCQPKRPEKTITYLPGGFMVGFDNKTDQKTITYSVFANPERFILFDLWEDPGENTPIPHGLTSFRWQSGKKTWGFIPPTPASPLASLAKRLAEHDMEQRISIHHSHGHEKYYTK